MLIQGLIVQISLGTCTPIKVHSVHVYHSLCTSALQSGNTRVTEWMVGERGGRIDIKIVTEFQRAATYPNILDSHP